MKAKENLLNLPNMLSAYRILAIPAIVWALFSENRQLFIVLICVNLVTDILDGLIARTFNLCTEFGAKLDSLADIGTFVLAISGFWIFENQFVIAHKTGFALILGFYALGQIAAVVKFGRPTSFHLYSSKALGYIQGIFIFTFFAIGYWQPYFNFMVAASCLAETEVLLSVLVLKSPVSNARSIFHLLKQKKNGTL